ncbi:MAG: FtsX-like permease family protein [Candidatus Hermodarchaeota archaeon]
MGITVYVDSYSVHYWDEAMDVGEVSMFIDGEDVDNIISDVRQIDGISEAVLLHEASAYVYYEFMGEEMWDHFRVCSPTQEYFDTYPGVFTVTNGRLPQNDSEIAVSARVEDWDWINISLGSKIGYTGIEQTDRRNVTVVGLYEIGRLGADDWYSYYYSNWMAMVVPSLLDQESEMASIHANVDRSGVTPFNAAGSLAYLTGIAEAIRSLDPLYSPQNPWSRYYVTNFLESGVYSYIAWQTSTRLNQLWRAAPVILLILMVSFLAIRHNVNERRYEADMLMARGASEGDVNNIVNREIGMIAVVSCGAGLLLGLVVSRIALGATGFFQFDISLMISEPWLITLESIILSLVTGILLPVVTLISYRVIYSTKKTVETSGGRLHKVSRGLTLIRWDALVVILASLLMIAMYSGGSEIQSNLILRFLASITPLPLFLGVASLVIKGVRRGAHLISGGLVRLVGEVPAFVGVRRIGKEASSAGPAIMVLVLAISLAWNSAVVDSTLPNTNLNQAKFAMGADVTFELDPDSTDLWDQFIENVTQHESTVIVSQVDIATLFLADEYGSTAYFVAIDPTEYAEIGYDHFGLRLNESDLDEYLTDLENDPYGVIITSDIAESYGLQEGDLIRAFEEWDSPQVYEFTIIGIVPAIPELLERASVGRSGEGPIFYDDMIVPPPGPYPYWQRGFGERRAWVHRDVARVLFSNTTQMNYYCVVSTMPGANDTAIAQDLLTAGGDSVIVMNRWGAVDFEVSHYLSQVEYHIDRALDTMLTAVTIGVIVGAFTIYAVEGVRARRREIALLRSMGATNSLIVKAQGAELLVLLSLSVLLLGVYGPLFLANSLLTAVGTYGSWAYFFPIVIFPVFPWALMLSVLAFFVVSLTLFIGAIAAFSSRVSLSAALNAAWAESGPYGGDL